MQTRVNATYHFGEPVKNQDLFPGKQIEPLAFRTDSHRSAPRDRRIHHGVRIGKKKKTTSVMSFDDDGAGGGVAPSRLILSRICFQARIFHSTSFFCQELRARFFCQKLGAARFFCQKLRARFSKSRTLLLSNLGLFSKAGLFCWYTVSTFVDISSALRFY